MNKMVRFPLLFINFLIFWFLNLQVVHAQTATPSAEATGSAGGTGGVPVAGTFEVTLVILLFGLGLLIYGVFLEKKNRQFSS